MKRFYIIIVALATISFYGCNGEKENHSHHSEDIHNHIHENEESHKGAGNQTRDRQSSSIPDCTMATSTDDWSHHTSFPTQN